MLVSYKKSSLQYSMVYIIYEEQYYTFLTDMSKDREQQNKASINHHHHPRWNQAEKSNLTCILSVQKNMICIVYQALPYTSKYSGELFAHSQQY